MKTSVFQAVAILEQDTANSYVLFVWFDRPGESSPEKDCCW